MYLFVTSQVGVTNLYGGYISLPVGKVNCLSEIENKQVIESSTEDWKSIRPNPISTLTPSLYPFPLPIQNKGEG